jgi:hypothetical protein
MTYLEEKSKDEEDREKTCLACVGRLNGEKWRENIAGADRQTENSPERIESMRAADVLLLSLLPTRNLLEYGAVRVGSVSTSTCG